MLAYPLRGSKFGHKSKDDSSTFHFGHHFEEARKHKQKTAKYSNKSTHHGKHTPYVENHMSDRMEDSHMVQYRSIIK